MSHEQDCGCPDCSPKDAKHAAECECAECDSDQTEHADSCSCKECKPTGHSSGCDCTECEATVIHAEACGCTDCDTERKAALTLTVKTEEKAGQITLRLKGSLDTVSAAEQGDAIVATLDKASTVVFDMGGVRFLSSAGIRVLIMTAKKAKSADKTFQLANLQPQVTQVLEMSGMLKIIPIV